MTPQMLHATLSTGQITIWEDRLDVAPKTQQQVLDWLQREEGLRACGFDELDREMQYRLLSHQDRCREMELPQPDYGAYRFFVLPRGPRTEFLYEEYEWDADYRPVTLYVWQSEDGWLDGNSTFFAGTARTAGGYQPGEAGLRRAEGDVCERAGRLLQDVAETAGQSGPPAPACRPAAKCSGHPNLCSFG